MDKIFQQSRFLFAIAIIAYGAENLACARFGLTVRGVPWFPVNPFLGYLTGIVLLAAGLSIVVNVQVRTTATLLGILFLLCVVFREVPVVVLRPMSVGARTVFFEALAMGASALTLAGTLPGESPSPRRWGRIADKLISSGPYLFAVASVVFGIDHFLVLALIASLVPSWMPGKMFLAYFTGAGFIAAGVSIAMKKIDQWGAGLLGTMFLLWFLLLHSPRVVNAFRKHNPNLSNEWSSAFIALGMCGGSWIVAWNARQRCGGRGSRSPV